ncbi:MAG: TonB-dependent receptor plug domain-containing protein [Flavobacteriales bacterium]|nr:TonB-dependent receptor plug domain-containing protein [Flavobacteriales bacterium]
MKQLWQLSLFILGMVVTKTTNAQNTLNIEGYIYAEISGAPVSHADISFSGSSDHFISDINGHFFATVFEDDTIIEISAEGFKPFRKGISTKELNAPLKFYLIELFNLMENSFKPSSIGTHYLESSQTDYLNLNPKTLIHLPYIFGEPELNKLLQTQAGIDFGLSGFGDISIRGDAIGQNQFLLNGIANNSRGHFGGFLSNYSGFNYDNVTVYKGAFPARFGGTLSSVIDISSNKAVPEEVSTDLQITLMMATLNVKAPIGKNGGFNLGFRRSLVDVLFSQSLGFVPVNSEFTIGTTFNVSNKDKLSFNYFLQANQFGYELDRFDTAAKSMETFVFKFTERSHVTNVQLNHQFNKNLSCNFMAGISAFQIAEKLTFSSTNPPPGDPFSSEISYKNKRNDFVLNADFVKHRPKKSDLRFGLQNVITQTNSGNLSGSDFDALHNLTAFTQYGDTTNIGSIESAAYIETERKFSDKLLVNFGARGVLYSCLDFTKPYIEPRVSGRYKLDATTSLKFGYARMNQFKHLYGAYSSDFIKLINWLPANADLLPQNANILSAGLVKILNENVQWINEAYFKTIDNQYLFSSYYELGLGNINEVSQKGKGKAYGLESSLNVRAENVIFFANLNLMKSNRQFDDLNNGEKFNFDFNRSYSTKLGLIVNASDQFIFSANFTFMGKQPFTLPTSRYRDIDGNIILGYDHINNYYTPIYSRLDLKVSYNLLTYGRFEFSVYNVLASQNVSRIFTQIDPNNSTQTRFQPIKQYELVFMPSLAYVLTL